MKLQASQRRCCARCFPEETNSKYIQSFIPITGTFQINLKKKSTTYHNIAKGYRFLVYLDASEKQFCRGVNFLVKYTTDDINIVMCIWCCDYRRGMDWIFGLLTTYTHHSELHVITALSLIYTLHFTVTHTGFSVFTSRTLATDFNTAIISDSLELQHT
jgi:hypothetical protein